LKRRSGILRRYTSILIPVIVCIVLLPSLCHAFGIGVVAGEPTGVSFKQWLSGANAVDAAAAWSFDGNDALTLHVGYLYHMATAGDLRIPGWKLYLGIGGVLKLEEDDNRLGARVPFGINYLFKSSPFDFFAEIVPILDLAPATEIRMGFGIGIRYFFGQPWKPDMLARAD
jgi:hypothetical protein